MLNHCCVPETNITMSTTLQERKKQRKAKTGKIPKSNFQRHKAGLLCKLYPLYPHGGASLKKIAQKGNENSPFSSH